MNAVKKEDWRRVESAMAPAMSAFRKVTFAAAVSTCVFNAFVWKTRQGICGINEFKPGSAGEWLLAVCEILTYCMYVCMYVCE